MFVNGVLMIFVELQQRSGMIEFRNDLFQHAQVMKPAQQSPELRGLLSGFVELADLLEDPRPDAGPGRTGGGFDTK